MNIVMIDGAIQKEHKCLMKEHIAQFYYKDGNWEILDNSKGTGHGTAVANILCSNIDIPVELINFCVFDSKLATTKEVLISALEYIYQNVDTPIINLSLGTAFDDIRLYDICKKIADKGTILVSAFDNNGAVSYPAAYDCVIGVDTSYKCLGKRDFVFVEDSIVNLRAMGGNQRVAWNSPEYTIISGASFAAAHVTNEIVNNCLGMDIENVLAHFKGIAKYVYENEYCIQNIEQKEFNINEVALLPFSKEMQSLLNFSNLLNFEITGVYDTKYSGRVGFCFETMDHSKKYIIENLDNCNWERIDTFVLGHVWELNPRIRDVTIEKIVEKCLYHGVNLFCFDFQVYKQYKETFAKSVLHIMTPYVDMTSRNKFGKLYRISRPILSVFGTSSQQGKYTLQLQLRELFLQHHYSVGQLGTEPTAMLFGMDECFPFGYNSPLRAEKCSRKQYVELINAAVHRIDVKNPDIIIAGCQSNLAPMVYNNLNDLTIEQMDYLMGVNPDVVILCVNPYDRLDYIKRSIKCIEGISNAKVLAIALFPFIYENNWAVINGKKRKLTENEIQKVCEEITAAIGLATYEIGNFESIKELFELCIAYF